MYVHHLRTLNSSGLIIIWDWTDTADDDTGDNSSVASSSNTISTESDLEEEESVSDSVVFKCIGVTRDSEYQDVLKSVSELLRQGKTVPVRMEAEPTNPYDAKAICFQCELDSQWKLFAYVGKELCDCVHEAISTKNIISAEFTWVKYKIVCTTGPGYYAAVRVTRKGKWPSIVHRFASTMY